MAESIYIGTNEAQALSRYLIGRTCSEEIAVHYTEAVNKLHATLTDQEQNTWNTMLSSRLYMKLVDSGLAITNPQSALRKRIFIMLALLEASPDHIAFFLPQERSIFYLIPLGFRLGFSALYLVSGLAFVKVAGIK